MFISSGIRELKTGLFKKHKFKISVNLKEILVGIPFLKQKRALKELSLISDKKKQFHSVDFVLAYSCAHAQALNEYHEGEMSTEVVVDRNFWTESVIRRRK